MDNNNNNSSSYTSRQIINILHSIFNDYTNNMILLYINPNNIIDILHLLNNSITNIINLDINNNIYGQFDLCTIYKSLDIISSLITIQYLNINNNLTFNVSISEYIIESTLYFTYLYLRNGIIEQNINYNHNSMKLKLILSSTDNNNICK